MAMVVTVAPVTNWQSFHIRRLGSNDVEQKTKSAFKHVALKAKKLISARASPDCTYYLQQLSAAEQG
jgi:hypothetical protein